MAPVAVTESYDAEETPMSRTHQYRKVMKPLLERKRRARINACLEELKELMVCALQTEGESISKLEKADVLELTVRHLQKLHRHQMLAINPALDLDRYHAGYTACATEVSRCLAAVPGVDITLGTRLMSHLGAKLKQIETTQVSPLTVKVPAPRFPVPKLSSPISDGGYSSGRDNSPSPNSLPTREMNFQQISPSTNSPSKIVWRPF